MTQTGVRDARVFRFRRGVAAAIFGLLAIWVALFAFMAGPGGPEVFVFPLALAVIFGLFALDFLLPGEVRVDADGLTIRRGFSRLRLRWASVARIDLSRLPMLLRPPNSDTPPERLATTRYVGPTQAALRVQLTDRREAERRGYFLFMLSSGVLWLKPDAVVPSGLDHAVLEAWTAYGTGATRRPGTSAAGLGGGLPPPRNRGV